MLSRRYVEEKPAARKWISSLDRWLKKVHGYSVLATGPLTPPTKVSRRARPSSEYTVSSNSKRYVSSTARPVIIVERLKRTDLSDNSRVQEQPQPIINLNDHYIEVYYCSKTHLNNVGEFEIYSRAKNNNLCYCCEDCLACKRDRNANLKRNVTSYSRHRPLNQVTNTAQQLSAETSKYSKNMKPHHSFT